MSYKATQSRNVYKTGSGTYRVRLMRNGTKISRNFNKYREAVAYRNELNQAN